MLIMKNNLIHVFYKGIILITFIFILVEVKGQKCVLKGYVKDYDTKEPLPGATVVVDGTSIGVATDIDGYFKIDKINPGSYRLLISYVSYEKLHYDVKIKAGDSVTINIYLKPEQISINEVTIKSFLKKNSDASLYSTIKMGYSVMTGVSAQQISKSLDKNAAEIVKRVSGVTVNDNRFIIVRGLMERYNNVFLNGSAAPGNESDKRSFSFDIIPGNQIDQILLYKSPVAEIPADFAGAMVKIVTKNVVDENKNYLSISTGFEENTTFHNFYTYKGGKFDWLGFDDGTRSLPSNVPSVREMKELQTSVNAEKQERLIQISKSFNKIWSPIQTNALPNFSILYGFNRYIMKKSNFDILTFNSISYSNSNKYNVIQKSMYQAYYDRSNPSYYYLDNSYNNSVQVGIIDNLIFSLGKSTKIEVRNVVNQNGMKTTTLRNGQNFYGGNYERNYELNYRSRFNYSGQIEGKHEINNFKFNWLAGYGYASQNSPDIRRVSSALSGESDPAKDEFNIGVNFTANPTMLGRLYLQNNEKIYTGAFCIEKKLNVVNKVITLKSGVHYENKNRSFAQRNFGYVYKNIFKFDWNSLKVTPSAEAFSGEYFNAVQNLLKDENLGNDKGLIISENTNEQDSYMAGNKLLASYLSVDIPISKKISIYSGLRFENNLQTLNTYSETMGDSINLNNRTKDFFPSLAVTYNITENFKVKLTYGKSINRPEFREISPYSFYDFEENATVQGNVNLKNSYIDNYDTRLEYYLSNNELISFGLFYKKFKNPIEIQLINMGSGYNYGYHNANKAISYGFETEFKFSLSKLNVFATNSFFNNLSFGGNYSRIYSKLYDNYDYNVRDSVRQMVGQSPYVLNLGVFYEGKTSGLNVFYNKIGERIAYVGDKTTPHVFERPLPSLDLTYIYRLGKITFKIGAKNLLNNCVEFRIYQTSLLNLKDNDGDGINDVPISVVEKTKYYKPGRSFSFSITYEF